MDRFIYMMRERSSMTIKKILLAALVLATLFICWRYRHCVYSWQRCYEEDVHAMYEILRENHPGFFDEKNPDFKGWLKDGYEQALGKRKKISSYTDYEYGLNFFAMGFKDNHVRLIYKTPLSDAQWPQFCIGYQVGMFRVVYSEIMTVPVGAQVVACDGQAPYTWLEKNVCPYKDARGIESSWFTVAPYLSLWEESCFVKKPDYYTFSLDGKIYEEKAEWISLKEDDYWSKFPFRKGSLLASLKEVRPGSIWVTLPSFYPQTEEQKEALNTVMHSIKDYRACKTMIFDLRGNGGGNSVYGTSIVQNLFGKAFCNDAFQKRNKDCFVEWRASDGNISYLKAFIPFLQKQFGNDEVTKHVLQVIEGMEKSKQSGDPLYKVVNYTEALGEGGGEPLTSARIVVITDQYCASACLDFLDDLHAVAPVTIMGNSTNADTEYMECRDRALPSGLAILHFPIKVFRNRTRKANQPYVSEIQIDPLSDEESFLRALL